MKTSCMDVYGRKICSSSGFDYGCSYFRKSANGVQCVEFLHDECINERAFSEHNINYEMKSEDRDRLIDYLLGKITDIEVRIKALEERDEDKD